MILKSKLPSVGTTIFTEMSALAAQYGAINLGQGFPDFDMDAGLTQLVNKAMADGFNQYTHANGYPVLRDTLASKVQSLYQQSINPDTQITISPGGTYAIYTAITTLIHPGDEVILFEPAYDSYIPNIEINGGVPVRINLTFPNYAIPWDEVRSKITPRTKMIMLNSPHNPTGAVLSEQDIIELKNIVSGTDIVILSDEVYEHLIFEDKTHQSILKHPDLLARSFVCFSFGKTMHCTGWKLGYCIAGESLMQEYRKVHQFNAFTCDTPKQVALAAYLNENKNYLNLGQQMQQKRDLLRQLLSATKLECIPSYGSYFECYSFSKISDENDKAFAIRLVKEYGVATIPVSAFYQDKTDHGVIRFCFAKKDETLNAAAERLQGL
jgi:methionine aminotransferase